ncbi:hypothetical protein BTVI_131636 [Pitangus sulphuratus]|nr:hypothetical protein BTVI_131636 [Pitangus sulphuratus]
MTISNMIPGVQNCHDLIQVEKLHPKPLEDVTEVAFPILVVFEELPVKEKVNRSVSKPGLVWDPITQSCGLHKMN